MNVCSLLFEFIFVFINNFVIVFGSGGCDVEFDMFVLEII